MISINYEVGITLKDLERAIAWSQLAFANSKSKMTQDDMNTQQKFEVLLHQLREDIQDEKAKFSDDE